MKIKQVTENSLILTLPSKQRYLGLVLTIFGIVIPVYLFISNNYQIIFPVESNLKSLIFNLSLGTFLIYGIGFQLPFIYYFFSTHNKITGYGHILLLFLNVIAYIGTSSSIYAFSPILLTGLYLLTHFKTIEINKTSSTFDFHERIFLLFFSKTSIPFSEIREIIHEYTFGLEFLNRTENKHQYNIKLSLLEKDPGHESVPIDVEKEKDSPEFFRPQTLRKTLLSKPLLIDSSLLNYNDHELMKFNKIVKELLRLTEFSQSEEVIKEKKTIIKFRE